VRKWEVEMFMVHVGCEYILPYIISITPSSSTCSIIIVCNGPCLMPTNIVFGRNLGIISHRFCK
jgi:hypothetical protein